MLLTPSQEPAEAYAIVIGVAAVASFGPIASSTVCTAVEPAMKTGLLRFKDEQEGVAELSPPEPPAALPPAPPVPPAACASAERLPNMPCARIPTVATVAQEISAFFVKLPSVRMLTPVRHRNIPCR